MLIYDQSWMFYNDFIATLHHFLGLTYWHSAKCQMLFSALFLFHRKSISNGVQRQWNFLEIFFGPEDIQWAKEVPERSPKGSTRHLGMPGGPGVPRWVVPPSGHPPVLLWPTFHVFWPRKFLQKVSLRLDSVWYWFSVKQKQGRKQQLALGTMSIG
jgi:hypothetical protein